MDDFVLDYLPTLPVGNDRSDHPDESSNPIHLFFCLFRNLSSVNDKTRQQMRDTPGLVDSLVSYIKTCLEEGKTEDKVKTRRPERELKV